MSNKLQVVRIVDGTSVDGPGLRTSIYFAGCKHRCPGCHNESTWPFDSGSDVELEEIIAHIRREGFNVTFSGGDPMYQAEALIPLAKAIKDDELTLWCYTGFTFEELLNNPLDGCRELLEYVDVLVDGPYVAALRDLQLHFRGSSNQRLIDVKSSLKSGKVVIID